jgi:hypothetical protein
VLEATTARTNRLLAEAAERGLQGVQEELEVTVSMVARGATEDLGMEFLLAQVFLVEMEEMGEMVVMVAQGALVPSPVQAVWVERADLEDPGGQVVKVPRERDGGQTAIQVLTVHLERQALLARHWQGLWRWIHVAVKGWAVQMVPASTEDSREVPLSTLAAGALAASMVSQAS